MNQIDLDDLPPRIAQRLEGIPADGELTLVRGGVVVARLRVAATATPATEPTPPSEQDMKEVLEQFNAMINDEF
jgi:hypothetical protein